MYAVNAELIAPVCTLVTVLTSDPLMQSTPCVYQSCHVNTTLSVLSCCMSRSLSPIG